MVKNLPADAGDAVSTPESGDSWRRQWQPTLVFLTGKSHGQRSLWGCSPWLCRRVGHSFATRHQQTESVDESLTQIL